MGTRKSDAMQDQLFATFAESAANARHHKLQEAITRQDNAFHLARAQLETVREELKDTSNFLGRMETKHGEVAEKIEVAIRNARQAMEQQAKEQSDFSATFDGVGRIAPEDYLIDGIAVQSKFINGLNSNLKHVIEHMQKYEKFTQDGAYYHIPKDTHAQILRILNGDDIEGIKRVTAQAVKDKALAIEAMSGRTFTDVVRSGESTYSEVQLYAADGTLVERQTDMADEHFRKTEEIKANESFKPSFEEAGRAALAGVAVGATVGLLGTIFQKHKQGKNLFEGDFTANDWKDLGLNSGKAALIGGFSSAGIYALTNCADLAAPFAGAVVTASKGVGSLFLQYKQGDIDQNDLVELSLLVCSEAAAVGACALIGQTVIPVPVLGAMLGAIAAKICCELLKDQSKKLLLAYEQRVESFKEHLNQQQRAAMQYIEQHYTQLESLTEAAFDLRYNCHLLELSAELAQHYGVDKRQIIHTISELDGFILG